MTPTILITGASSGIGRAAAKRFQSAGWQVIATMRTPQHERELNTLDRVLVERLDVLDLASIDSAVAAGLARFGRIDVLLNNAGYGAYGPLEATPIEKIRRQFDVNVLGVLATTKAVLPHMRAQGSGTVLNISSIGGKMTFPLGSLYHGTKFAVEGLSESLHYELLPLGIRVKVIEPGMVKTDMLKLPGAPKPVLALEADQVADLIWDGMKNRKQTIYVAGIWKLIMLVIRHIPSFVFRRLNF